MNHRKVFLLTFAKDVVSPDIEVLFEKKREAQLFFIGLKQHLKIKILSKINIQPRLIRSFIRYGMIRYYLSILFGDKFPIILLFREIMQKSEHLFLFKLYGREILIE